MLFRISGSSLFMIGFCSKVEEVVLLSFGYWFVRTRRDYSATLQIFKCFDSSCGNMGNGIYMTFCARCCLIVGFVLFERTSNGQSF